MYKLQTILNGRTFERRFNSLLAVLDEYNKLCEEKSCSSILVLNTETGRVILVYSDEHKEVMAR